MSCLVIVPHTDDVSQNLTDLNSDVVASASGENHVICELSVAEDAFVFSGDEFNSK